MPSIRKGEATSGFEPLVEVLQTPALPLGYVAVSPRTAPLIYQMCLGAVKVKFHHEGHEEHEGSVSFVLFVVNKTALAVPAGFAV